MVVNKGKQSLSINKNDLQQEGGIQQHCQAALLLQDSHVPTHIPVKCTVYLRLCPARQFPIFPIVELLDGTSEWRAGVDEQDFSQAQPALLASPEPHPAHRGEPQQTYTCDTVLRNRLQLGLGRL